MKQRLAELAAKFLDRSRGDLAAMRAALATLGAGQVESLGEIRNLAHRMVGTGATLGFIGLSDLARRIEQITEQQPAGQVPGRDVLAQLGESLDALATGLRQQQ